MCKQNNVMIIISKLWNIIAEMNHVSGEKGGSLGEGRGE
jgi:hypothetical protein